MATVPRPRARLSRRRLLADALGASLVGVLASCAPAPSPTPAAPGPPTAAPKAAPPTQPTAAPTPAAKAAATPAAAAKAATTPAVKTRVTWKHAHVPILIHSAFMQMGLEKGYFAEQGIDIEFSGVQDGNTATKAVIAGELDSSGSSPAAAIIAIIQGAPVKLAGTVLPKVTNYLYGKTDIKSLQDLYGRNVGVGTVGAYLYQLGTGAMKRQGLDPNKVNWVSVGTSNDVWNALVAGKIDAGVSSMDVYPNLPKQPELHMVTSFAEALPDYLYDAFPITDKNLSDRKDVVVRVFTAMTKGVRYAIEHKDEFVALAKKMTGQEESTINFIHETYTKNHLVEANLRLTREQISFTQRFSVEAGQQDALAPYDKVATDTISNTVIASLGEYKY